MVTVDKAVYSWKGSMNYAETLSYLYGLSLFGAHFGLATTEALAAMMGNPHQRLRFIHVAGTNGKGSTCAMLESVYREAGLRVGLYTSPHLACFRERIQVNRACISEQELVRLATLLRKAADERPVTLFEFTTVMAMRHFAEQNCDLVIWEAGLGGRLDATNIVTPLASVITNIALDHQQWLGDTTAKIAREKAGIIKPGIPVITMVDDAPALAVIKEEALRKGSPLIKVEPPAPGWASDGTPSFDPGLAGQHQKWNAAAARATVEALQGILPVPEAALRRGLAGVQWPGRFQIVPMPNGIKMVLDGAHNLAGVEALALALKDYFPGQNKTLILGVLEDKDWAPICHRLAPLASRLIIVPVASPRSARPVDLARECMAANPSAMLCCAGVMAEALAKAGGDGLVIVTGSLYLVGEAMEILGLLPGDGARSLNDWGTGRDDKVNFKGKAE